MNNLRMWKGSGKSGKKSHNKRFTATVVDVHSGDSVSVRKPNGSENIRLFMANIKAPRVANQMREGDLFGFEAKDFLRKCIIGKQVKVEIEYEKSFQVKFDPMDPEASMKDPV